MTPSSSISKPSIALVLLALIALVSAGFIASPPPAEALTVSQCNSTDNQGDRALTCDYLVTNNLNGSVTSSSIELTACSGFRSDPATMVCTSSTTLSTDLVTSVEQCNGSGNLRATVTCSVTVVNNITATVTATPATVDQCNGSGAGGGADPLKCSPYPANTTSATVTQCNDSGNGGGATERVNCSVGSTSTTTSLLPVTVNQCNGSGNGGYGYLYCTAQLTDVITAPAASPSPSPSVSATPSPPAPPPPNPPNPNPPPPNPPPNPPTPTQSATPTPTPSPRVTPTPSITPSPDTTLEPDTTTGDGDGDVGGAGGGGGLEGAGGAGGATGGGGAGLGGGGTGGGELRGGDDEVRGIRTTVTGGATTTGQVTHVPEGGANTGGGSTSGIESPRLLLLGFMLLGAAWPALAVRRRAVRTEP